jgi:hypothetical protein
MPDVTLWVMPEGVFGAGRGVLFGKRRFSDEQV